MGDKFQGYPLAHFLLENNVPFKPINFSPPDETDIDDIIPNLKIHSPLDSSLPTPKKILIFSGSLDWESPWFHILEEKEECDTIIWGGFSRGYLPIEEYSEKMKILKRENLSMLCRSKNDLDLYQSIIGNKNRGISLGDPLVWWLTEEALSFPIPMLAELKQCVGLTAVISFFCFENYPEFWKGICRECDTLVCVDPNSDGIVSEFLDGREIIFVREVWDFIKIIKSAKSVISSRLHSSILSLLLGIPTITISSDNPTEENLGSYKFYAVIKNTFGYGCGLGEVYSPENINFNYGEILKRSGFISEERNKLYFERTRECYDCIKKWCCEI